MLTADLVVIDHHPLIDGGKVEEWIEALEFIHAAGVRAVVHGHGSVSHPSVLEEVADYLAALLAAAPEAPLPDRFASRHFNSWSTNLAATHQA